MLQAKLGLPEAPDVYRLSLEGPGTAAFAAKIPPGEPFIEVITPSGPEGYRFEKRHHTGEPL